MGTGQGVAHGRFEPWEEEVFFAVAMKHGISAAERLRQVHDLVIQNQDRPVLDKLKLVNSYVNNFTWIADPVLWNSEDYWAAPFETITAFGGDCEDLAIVKYGILRMMGIADKKLGLVYVQSAAGRHHIVLLYMETQGADALILDNQHPDVLPATERRDIVGIYLFQNDGTVYLFEGGGIQFSKIKARYADRRLSKWSWAMEREKKNIDLYVKFNGGRPLLPLE